MRYAYYLAGIVCLFLFIRSATFAQTAGQMALMKGDSLYELRDYTSCIRAYESAAEYYEVNQSPDSLLLVTYNIAYALFAQRDYSEAEEVLRECLNEIDENKVEDQFILAKGYNMRAFATVILDEYATALQAYNEAIKIYEANEMNHHNVAYAYRGAAQIYMRRLDYERSIIYLEKGLQSDSTMVYQASLYAYLAQASYFLNNFDQAYEYYSKGLVIANPASETEATLQVIGADILSARGDYEAAQQLYLKSYEAFNRPVHWDERFNIMLSLGESADKNNKKEEAIHYFREAKKEIDTSSPGKNRERASLLVAIGSHYEKNGQPDSAIYYFHQAILQVVPDFKESDPSASPDTMLLYPEPWIMTASAKKGTAFLNKYEKTGNLELLKHAQRALNVALSVIDVLRDSYGTEEAKLYIGDYGYTYFETAIKISTMLYQATGNSSYSNEVFRLMELSKAVVLKEVLSQNEAVLKSNIPDSVWQKEQQIRERKADLQKSIAQYKMAESEENESEIKRLRQSLWELENAASEFIRLLSDNYPSFQSKYDAAFYRSNLTDIQQQLETGELLLSFFWGENSIFLTHVGPTSSGILEIKDSEKIVLLIREYLDFLRFKDKYLRQPDRFYVLAYALYTSLGLKETLEGAKYQKLYVVPDGALNFIPLDALLTQPYQSNIKGEIPYLIRSYTIQYSYTSSLLFRQKNEITTTQKKVLLMAPEFRLGQRNLATLKFGNREIGDIHAKRILGEEASVDRFKELAPRFQLIHLSTHGEAGTEGQEPKIEFIDNSLVLPEIYALPLSAELVVLSACETGVGQLKRGEGVMSFARGFLFAGASSLISTLWKVNERSTADIFSAFYEHLENGLSRSEALRQAKLNYLNNTEQVIQQSPYYWAGIVSLGQDGPIPINDNQFSTYYIWMIGGLFILLAGFFFIRNSA